MNMHTLKASMISAVTALVFLAPVLVSADSHHTQSPTFRSTQLTDNIFMLQGKGGNLGLIKGEQGLLLIDADYNKTGKKQGSDPSFL